MNHEEADKRIKIMHELISAAWNSGPISLAHELREMLKHIVDEGTGIDSSAGDGIADLWPIIGGQEYHIQISARPANRER